MIILATVTSVMSVTSAIVTSVIKPLIMNYLIKFQMIIAKTIAGLKRITWINNFNNSRPIQYVSKNDINNENVRKPSSAKRVYIAWDSIVKQKKNVNGYDISRKTQNSKVFVRPSHGATVKCMTDHVFWRDNPNHIVFHIGTNDIPSKETPETKAKWILKLAISSKSNTCGVSILNIFIR